MERTSEAGQAAPQLLLSGDPLLHAIVARVAGGVAVVRPGEGAILDCNPALDALFRYGAGELPGRPVTLLFPAGDASARQAVAAMTSALHAEEDWQGDLLGCRSDGTVVTCDVRLFTVAGPARGPFGIICVSEVAGRTSQAMRETGMLEEVNASLARSNADLSRFASVAAHDLKSPLQAVMGFGELLAELDSVVADPQASEYATLLLRSAHRMHALVDDLLDYCRVGATERHRGRVDCSLIFAETVEAHHAEIAESGAVVTSDDLPVLEIDGGLLFVVLSNLVSNAVKFHADGVAPSVHVSARPGEGEWRFAVVDNGIGIDPRFRERAFDMFRRLPGSGSYPGTGMGLAICRRALDGVGGRIWVEANPSGGTMMCFTLPVAGARP